MTFLKIRYKYIHHLVNDIYINHKIHSFPININNIICSLKNYKIKILSYSTVMKKYKLTEEEVLDMLTSKDGCSVCSKGRHVIYYNDLGRFPHSRIRWTIAHELGHILCGHFENNKTKVSQTELLSDEEYKIMEKEADYFAAMLLAHPKILVGIDVKTAYEIEKFCNISKKASKNTFKNLKVWKKYNFSIESDKYIAINFKKYIDTKINDYKEHLAFVNAFYY